MYANLGDKTWWPLAYKLMPFSSATLAGLILFLSLTLWSSLIVASEYCTKEQYESDRVLIENAINAGTIVKGPKNLPDSILVQEETWFAMNYPKQIAFMQSFECAMGGAVGKDLLYMDVRSLSTGRLLARWSMGALNPAHDR